MNKKDKLELKKQVFDVLERFDNSPTEYISIEFLKTEMEKVFNG